MRDNRAIYKKLAIAYGLLAECYQQLADGEPEFIPADPSESKSLGASITIEQILAAMSAKRREGKIDGIRELLSAHGAGRASELKPEDYPRFLQEVEAL